MKLHRRAAALIPCLIPCNRCEKSAGESRNSFHLITQRDNTHARINDMFVDPHRYLSSWWSNFTNRKIVIGERGSQDLRGAFHSTKNSGNSGLGSEWNRHFPEFHFEILGVPREVGLKFRRIGITGKFSSIQPFLLVRSFSEPGNRNSTWLILKLLNI